MPCIANPIKQSDAYEIANTTIAMIITASISNPNCCIAAIPPPNNNPFGKLALPEAAAKAF
jgi:hypothetical protein